MTQFRPPLERLTDDIDERSPLMAGWLWVTRTPEQVGKMLAHTSLWATPNWEDVWARDKAEWTANGQQLLDWLAGDYERPDE